VLLKEPDVQGPAVDGQNESPTRSLLEIKGIERSRAAVRKRRTVQVDKVWVRRRERRMANARFALSFVVDDRNVDDRAPCSEVCG
jgi:hypothetical protein